MVAARAMERERGRGGERRGRVLGIRDGTKVVVGAVPPLNSGLNEGWRHARLELEHVRPTFRQSLSLSMVVVHAPSTMNTKI